MLLPEQASGLRGVRVAHLAAPGAYGGLESVVGMLTSGLVARGAECSLILMVEPGAKRPELWSEAAAAGVRVVPIVTHSRNYLGQLRALRRHFRSGRPQIIHTHGYVMDVLAPMAAAGLGLRLVSTAHGMTGGGWKNLLYERLQRRAWRRFDRVIAVSRPLSARLIAGGLSATQCVIIQNGWAAPREFLARREARAELGLAQDDLVLGWVGRFSAEKGPDLALRAMALLPDSPAVLVMVGSGREESALRSLATELALTSRVRWAGPIPSAGRLMHGFDAFILSSRTEGTPIALLEAMAAGTPAVVTAVGGVGDVISDREGWLAQKAEPALLARAIAEALAQPDARRNRAASGVTRVASQFGLGPWLDRHAELYRRLVAETTETHP